MLRRPIAPNRDDGNRNKEDESNTNSSSSQLSVVRLRSKLLRRAEGVLVQPGARRHGTAGIHGTLGIVDSVTYRLSRTRQSSNRTLSA